MTSAISSFGALDAIRSLGTPSHQNAELRKLAVGLVEVWQLTPAEPLVESLAGALHLHLYASAMRETKATKAVAGNAISKQLSAAKKKNLSRMKKGLAMARQALEDDAKAVMGGAVLALLDFREYRTLCSTLTLYERLLAMHEEIDRRVRPGLDGAPPHPTFNDFVKYLQKAYRDYGGKCERTLKAGILSLDGKLPKSATSDSTKGFDKRVQRALGHNSTN